MKNYVSRYTRGDIVLESGELYFQAGKRIMRMISVSETYFILEGETNIRIQFKKHETGRTYEIVVIFSHGGKEVVKRLKQEER